MILLWNTKGDNNMNDITVNDNQAIAARLCCPTCGNTQLSVVTDRDFGAAAVGGVVNTAIGGLGSGILSAASNLQQQTFFVCSGCGTRFRNPNELRSEAALYGKRSKGITIACIILLALCGFLLITSISTFLTVFSLFFMAVLLFCIVFMKNKAKKPLRELQKIESGMKQYI